MDSTNTAVIESVISSTNKNDPTNAHHGRSFKITFFLDAKLLCHSVNVIFIQFHYEALISSFFLGYTNEGNSVECNLLNQGSTMSNTLLLKTIWNRVYNPESDTAKIVHQFFHPDYEQCINGIYMNRQEYLHHVLEQKNNMSIEEIEYKHIIENNNELFALYYPKGKNANHMPIKAEVIACFHFKKQQILKIHGQVRLLEGDLADVDMTKA